MLFVGIFRINLREIQIKFQPLFSSLYCFSLFYICKKSNSIIVSYILNNNRKKSIFEINESVKLPLPSPIFNGLTFFFNFIAALFLHQGHCFT